MTKSRDEAGRTHVILRADGERTLVATRDFKVGDAMLYVRGEIAERPTKYTVQVDRGVHIDVPDQAELDRNPERYGWRFLNHSCAPNAWIRGRELLALRAVEAGEELTFDYNTTEYVMAQPFDCWCGARSEPHKVRGYKFLDAEARAVIADHLAPHLRDRD